MIVRQGGLNPQQSGSSPIMPHNNRSDKRQNPDHTEPREELPGGPRSMDKKDPPPHTRNSAEGGHSERHAPRGKR
jgi:hypothetical protein